MLSRTLLILGLSSFAAWAQTGPPTPEDLRQRMRQAVTGMGANDDKLRDFEYRVYSERLEYDGDGKLKKKDSTRVRYERWDGFRVGLLEEADGKPVPPADRAKSEEAIRKRLAELKAKPPAEIARMREENRRKQAEESSWLKEMPEALDYKFVGRETMGGRSVLVMTCSPRPGYSPKNMRARLFEKVNGKMWMDEQENEILRAEGEAFDTISIGWGLIGRIEKGTRFRMERTRLDNGTWVAKEQTIRFAARFLMVKQLSREMITRWSDFRPIGQPAVASAR